MKLSKSFWQTYKEAPSDAVVPSHVMMMRAGLIQKVGAGLYNYLPFGYRTIRKIEQIVREEMDRIDSQEILMTVVTPGELWQESGRWDKMGGEMLTFKDKRDADLCISPTNEETVTDIFRKSIKSYKSLPLGLYQINTKFRDEIRPRFGLMRAREFIMKDAYSFHIDKACLDKGYEAFYCAYEAIFNRVGLEFFAVEADAGNMGSSDSKTHEFQVVADTGEDALIYSRDTSYAANIEKAQTKRADLSVNKNDSAVTEVETPAKGTIEEVCTFLGSPECESLKSLVYKAINGNEEKFYLLLLLGDDSLNEVKLKNALGAEHIMPATDNELASQGFVKGFIGPVNLSAKVEVVLDSEVSEQGHFVVGANKKDYHLKGVKPGRDFSGYSTLDLRMAKAGDKTLDGKGVVEIRRGIEVGHIFQLGSKYTKALNVSVLDHNGKAVNPLMGCYGIGVTRVMAAAIEQHHDAGGIIWPKAIAPYDIYFALIAKSEKYKNFGEEVYNELKSAGFDVVYDDRNAGAGFKFKDSDLLGLPLRVVLGERDYEQNQCFEIIVRASGEKHSVKHSDLVSTLKKLWDECK